MTEPIMLNDSDTSTTPSTPVALPEPLTLTIQETGAVVGFMCRDCTLTHYIARQTALDKDAAHEQAKTNAKRCCNRICECGTPVEHQCYLYCDVCRAKHEVEREQIRYKHAKKISPLDYNDWVFVEGYGNNNGYFPHVEALRNHCHNRGKQLPPYVWTCSTLYFSMDADSIIDQALDEHHEDAGDNIGDAARGALQYMLDAWAEKQGIKSHDVDHGIAVVIPEQWIADSKERQEVVAREKQAMSTTEET